MIRSLVLAGAAALVLSAAAHAQMIGPSPAGGPRATKAFITQAAQSDEFERREGRLAERRATNPAVRAFARRMVADHTRTTRDLQRAIRRSGMAPPPPPALAPDQKGMLAQLNGMRGRAFDRTYIAQQVDAHQNALQLMNGFAQAGEPPPLREAAKNTAPLIQHHLDMARNLQARIGG